MDIVLILDYLVLSVDHFESLLALLIGTDHSELQRFVLPRRRNVFP